MMLLMKICGIITLIITFAIGIKKWMDSADKESVIGLVLSYMLCLGSMFGAIYLINT